MRVRCLFLLAVGALSLTCRERRISKPEIPVFLISIDTLRSDRLPAYGYPGGSTPAIDAFRRDAILFERAFSHSPLTLPSHATILTGLEPAAHGVRDNAGYTLLPTANTLAGTLQHAGYATGAAVSSYVLRRESGVARGFDFYDDAMEVVSARTGVSEERDGDRTRQSLEAWLQGQTNRKLLAFLHLYEPHTPYQPPSRFSGGDAYDGEVSYADSIVGDFLSGLKGRGWYDDALIILLSDHGEGLGDHGEDEHGIFLYRESIQVPLIIKLPGNERAGQVIRAPVGLKSVSPTILRRLGLSEGLDLLSAAPQLIFSETYFPRIHLGWSELFSAIDGSFHYIEAPRGELYEYMSDPKELRNIAAEQRRITSRLKAALNRLEKRFIDPARVDPEQREKLAALGYLGSAAPGTGPLPDPKDHVGAVRLLKKAFAARQAGEHSRALPILQQLVSNEPGMVDGWTLLAQTRRDLGDINGALQTMREATGRFPGRSDLTLLTSEILLGVRRSEEARRHAELALPLDEAGAREMLAKIALQRNDKIDAERQLSRVLELQPSRLSALLVLAQVHQRTRNPEAMLHALDRAAALVDSRRLASIRDLDLKRGEALLELGRVGEAEQALRRETIAFPQNLQAWGLLAIAAAAQGREAEAREILAEAVRRNPGEAARKLANETLVLLQQRGSSSPKK